MNFATPTRAWYPFARYRDRLIVGVTLSLLIHAFIISLQFGIPGLGLPGLALPWNERRAQAPELNVRLANVMSAPASSKEIQSKHETPVAKPDGASARPHAQEQARTETPVEVPPPARTGVTLVPLPDVSNVPLPAEQLKPVEKAISETKPPASISRQAPPQLKSPTPVITQTDPHPDTFVVPAASPDEPVSQAAPKIETPNPPTEIAEKPVTEPVTAKPSEETTTQAEEQAAQKLQAEEAARQARELAAKKQEEAKAERRAMELEARRQAEETARQQAAALARQKQAEELAAKERAQEFASRQQAEATAAQRERERISAASQPAVTSRTGENNKQGGTISLPRSLVGGDLAGKALDQAKKLDLSRIDPQAIRQSNNETESSLRRSIFGSVDQDIGLTMYIESWRLKIERNGSLNYAQSSKEKARYDPVVTVAIRSDGSIENIVINRSSGRADLDEAVRRIARLNARYSAFPPNLARKYDVIEIRRIWNFDDTLRIQEEMR